MKTLILCSFLLFAVSMQSQSLLGTWQIVDQTTCEDVGTSSKVEVQGILQFKDESSGTETMNMLESRKPKKERAFIYKYDGNLIYFLDKRSQLLLSAYKVEKITSDSLIISNTRRACDTRIFSRANQSE